MVKLPLITILFLLIIISIVFCPLLFAAEPLEPGNHYFTADWCNACQKQIPIVKQLQEEGYDIQIHTDLENFNIRAIPYFIIIKADKTITKLKGLQPYKKLVKVLNKVDIKIGNIEIKVN